MFKGYFWAERTFYPVFDTAIMTNNDSHWTQKQHKIQKMLNKTPLPSLERVLLAEVLQNPSVET